MDAIALEGNRVQGRRLRASELHLREGRSEALSTALYRTSLQEYSTSDQPWTRQQ